ncbi:MAG: glutamate 5-kinase [Planctomycetes bacterium]|nr:glutamate 5-kinase [Planctomycetota bacterium]
MPDKAVRQQILARARKIVVKVGTNALTGRTGRLDPAMVGQLAGQIARVMAGGTAVTLVASGAIGAGMAELDLPDRPGEIAMLQATAAVGQGQLMRQFHDAFASHGLKVAQVLLTREDFENRKRYLNIRNTLSALAKLRVVPIINENDAVAVEEIRYGDNDIISAHLANMLRADVLVLLSVVDGVLHDGKVLDVIERVDEGALSVAGEHRSRLGSGGMKSKMAAAGLVTAAGEIAVIANAREPDVLPRLLAGERVGTVFLPARRKMSSRLRWIGQAARTAGSIVIDDGAVRAIVQNGKSLLPSGVLAVAGQFRKGATVAIRDGAGRDIAKGIVNYSAAQLDRIKGLKTAQIAKVLGDKPADEVIHRNNMTLV